MKSDYWNVTDDQVTEKTGKSLTHWMKLLAKFGADSKKSNDAVEFLQKEHAVPRYWARTLATRYFKDQQSAK